MTRNQLLAALFEREPTSSAAGRVFAVQPVEGRPRTPETENGIDMVENALEVVGRRPTKLEAGSGDAKLTGSASQLSNESCFERFIGIKIGT